MEIKKAIVPIAGLGTRFLPLSKVLPKGLWPLVDKPVIQYIIEEIKSSGISQIIFVIGSEKKAVLDSFKKSYFQKSPKLEKKLREQNKTTLLKEVKELQDLYQNLSFAFTTQ
jgi:UTP--glucose-1-phosphate uridylyltransferase